MDAYSLGQLLRKARSDRELTLEDAKIKTRISVTILDSFEQGLFQIADLSQVQVRGMLSNYAAYLGLEPETILNYYDDSQAAGSRRRRKTTAANDPSRGRARAESRRATQDSRGASEVRRPQTEPRPTSLGDPTNAQRPETLGSRRDRRTRRGRGFLNLLVVVTLTVASVAAIVAIATELLQRSPDASIDPGVDTEGNSLANLPATLTFTPMPSPTTIRTPTLLPRSPQNYQGEPVLVTVDFLQRAWVRVIVDGAELYAGLVRPGELTLEYRAINEIIISSSNAEALAVTYNGVPQTSYGGRGQEVEIVYRPAGNVSIETGSGFAPTSEFTETPRPTSAQLVATLLAEGTPTATEGPSPTPSETFTPTVSPEFSPTLTATPTFSLTPSITATITASATASATNPPTDTPQPSQTATPSAIVPPRATAVNSTPGKSP